MTEEEKKFKILKIERLESETIESDKKIILWSVLFGLNFLSVMLYLINKNSFEIPMLLKVATSCTICSVADLVMLIIVVAKKIGLEKSIYDIKAELDAYEQLEREGKSR